MWEQLLLTVSTASANVPANESYFMWQHQFFELFTYIIPQSFIFLFLFFTLTDIKFEKKPYIILAVSLSILVFLVRLYVSVGVHSVIMLLVLVFIAVAWKKVNIITAVIHGIITYIVGYLCELPVVAYLFLFNHDLYQLLIDDPATRTKFGIITLIPFLLIALAVYFFKKKKKKKKEELEDATVSEDIK